MVNRDKLNLYLKDFLDCDRFSDYAPNGLQIEGKDSIKRLCTAVTASEDVISQAISCQADALLVHHGYFWRGEDPVLKGMKRQRIAKLLSHDISLFAYHLPLDCHPELGNNACIAKLLQIDSIQMHRAGSTDNLLWTGTLNKAMGQEEFVTFLKNQFQRKPLPIEGHNRSIQNIAWCTGAAQDFIENASNLGMDAFISGEVSERTWYQAKELGINYYSCGHHATERLGVQALGEHLSSEFKLEHVFLDSDNLV